MANYEYANNPQTTLAGAVTAGAAAITVASATGFPTRGKFTIIVDSEIMLVTGVSGTTWTVTRGTEDTAAAAHNNNATVTGILTKHSFLNAHHFDPRAFGAVGDGSTDDTTALNEMIAALNAAGSGRVVFPPGTFKATSALTTITASCVIEGAGPAGFDGSTSGTLITQTSSTANLFTVTGYRVTFRDIGMRCTHANPTAGAGVDVNGDGLSRVDYENISITGFYDNIHQEGCLGWSLRSFWILDPVRYGIRIHNDTHPDGGDYSILDGNFVADTHAGSAAIRIESSGGAKINNVKINMGYPIDQRFVNGIDVAVGNNVKTSDFQVSNCSIENVTGTAIKVTTSATNSTWGHFLFTNLQVALYSTNTTGSAIELTGANANDIFDVVIDGCTLRGNPGSSAPAIKMTNVLTAEIGAITHNDFDRGVLVTTSTDIIVQGGGPTNFKEVKTPQTIGATETVVTGLSAPHAKRLAHVVRVTAKARWSQSVASDIVRFRIRQDGVTIQEWTASAGSTVNWPTYFDQAIIFTPTGVGGIVTFDVTAQVLIGSGTMTVQSDASWPSWLLIEDLGAYTA